MWPSFSLWAWRILKIRSCLRRPLAPGISSVRAMRLSSVMFFSFNSEMVIFTYGSNSGRGLSGKESCWSKQVRRVEEGSKRPRAGPRLCCAALLDLRSFRCCGGCSRRALVVEADQNLIGGVLEARVWLVQLARCLGGQLTQCVTILNVGK